MKSFGELYLLFSAKLFSCFSCCDTKFLLAKEEKIELKFNNLSRKRSEGSIHCRYEDRLATSTSHHRSNAVMETIEENDSSFDW